METKTVIRYGWVACLSLGLATSTTLLAAQKIPKPKFVQAKTTTKRHRKSVPKLSVSDVQKSSQKPFNLSQHLGLDPNSRIHINGFMSAGVTKTNSDVPYSIPGRGAVDNNWNFSENSLMGIQVSGDITQQLSVVTQLVADGDNTNGNKEYRVNLDWAFIKYHIGKDFTSRAGRFRLPAFMYSATQEIGYSYPWVFLPNEVYRIVPFNNINGVDTAFSRSLGGSGWVVTLQPYVGANSSQYDMYTSNTLAVPAGKTANFKENSVIGGVAKIENRYLSLRGTYIRMKLTGDLEVLQDGGTAAYVDDQFVHNQKDSFYAIGGKFHYRGWMVNAEFAHRETPTPLASLSGLYAMVGYKFMGILPNVTYGRIWTTNKNDLRAANTTGELPTELEQSQQSVTGGLDYYLKHNIVFKGAVSWIRPLDNTIGLFRTANPSLVKRNNYLYTMGIDAIF